MTKMKRVGNNAYPATSVYHQTIHNWLVNGCVCGTYFMRGWLLEVNSKLQLNLIGLIVEYILF